MPLRNHRQGFYPVRSRLVKRLKWRRSPGAVINAPGAPGQVRGAVAVNSPGPGSVSDPVEFVRPLALEHRLGPSVALLLAPISAHGIAAPMPDHRRRAEAQGPAFLLEAPANVDIVTRHAELGVEAADGLEA